MEIDLSKVVLLLLAVLPGYVARRGSDRVRPRAERKLGATEEVASFVILSAIVHVVLAALLLGIYLVVESLKRHTLSLGASAYLSLPPSELWKNLNSVSALWFVLYFLLSLIVGRCLGLIFGLLDAWAWRENLFNRLGLVDTRLGRFWSRKIDRYLLSNSPILYKILLPQLDETNKEKTVYVEIDLKGDQGSITGRVVSFSTSNDEESHKLIFLQDVYKKDAASKNYQKLPADGMLLDLADALTVQVKQV